VGVLVDDLAQMTTLRQSIGSLLDLGILIRKRRKKEIEVYYLNAEERNVHGVGLG